MRKKVIISSIIVLVLAIPIKLFLEYAYVPPIFMYHSIDEKADETKLSVCPLWFAKQMKFLYDHDYNVIPLKKMVDYIKSGKRVPYKTVTITFDDGFKNNFECALPVLKKYGFPATVFVITDLVGVGEYMSWDDIKVMQENNITIGSHTKAHKWLPSLSKERLRKELVGSKKIIEQKTGKKVEFLSYPIGAYNDEVQKAVKEAGYYAAVATNPGPKADWKDIYALKRLRISRTSDNMFVLWINASGYYTFIKEIRDDD